MVFPGLAFLLKRAIRAIPANPDALCRLVHVLRKVALGFSPFRTMLIPVLNWAGGCAFSSSLLLEM